MLESKASSRDWKEGAVGGGAATIAALTGLGDLAGVGDLARRMSACSGQPVGPGPEPALCPEAVSLAAGGLPVAARGSGGLGGRAGSLVC